MAKKFKIGDIVRISNLNSKDGYIWTGTIGHEGKIVEIEDGAGSATGIVFYVLDPYCSGKCWPAECLEMVKPAKVEKIKGTLFSIDDL